jgi:hypothetical protein
VFSLTLVKDEVNHFSDMSHYILRVTPAVFSTVFFDEECGEEVSMD